MRWVHPRADPAALPVTWEFLIRDPRFRRRAIPAITVVMPTIDTLRERLLARRSSLRRRVDHLADDLRRLDESVGPEIEEEGQEQNLSRVLVGLDDRGRTEIATVDRALGLIDRGDYGRCEDCREDIPLARLEALPTATTCVPCAEERARSAATHVADDHDGARLLPQDTPTDDDLPVSRGAVPPRSRKRATTATRS
jgi:RNA polymerase-binding protein DksA